MVGNLTWLQLIIEVGHRKSGDAVRAARVLLPQLTVDGVFGDHTRSAVIKFQEQWGLDKDGVAGPITWRTLVIPKFD